MPEPSTGTPIRLSRRAVAATIAILIVLTGVYWQVLGRLFDAWTNDGNYSHGWLIIPLAAYFAWERRDRLFATPARPSTLGLVVILGSLFALVAGLLGAEMFLTRLSIVGTTVGIVLFLFGWGHLRILTFPLAFLLLMIPIPAIIFNQIAFPLQLFASQFGEFCMTTARIPVLREGNVLILAHTSLEVAEACSGIRSLISLVTLGLVFGYFSDPRMWVRTVIVLSAVPVAIVANGMRVAGTGMAAQWYGPEAAQGFFHDFSGWAVFGVAFALMLLIHRLILSVVPKKAEKAPAIVEPVQA
jgi:exosortase